MLVAHTVAEIRAAESSLMARLPDGALMQRAAVGLAHAVIRFMGGAVGQRVILLVGSGDNGGDALYAGAFLARRGASVEAWLLGDRAHPGGLDALRRAGGRVSAGHNPGLGGPQPGFRGVVVDGIVGIGGSGALRPEAAAVVNSLAGIPMVAVDLPSGVDADTGHIAGAHVQADLTVTFGCHRVAHLVDPGAGACGRVELIDIGLEFDQPSVYDGPRVEALQVADAARLLPRPRPDDQKYRRGVVGVRAGSARYPGAGVLCVAGANTGLAGMVRYVGAADASVKAAHPEVVGDGRVQAWVVGSGTDKDASDHLDAARADWIQGRGPAVPIVVDADALAEVSASISVPAVLTPHAGELAAMLQTTRDRVEAEPLAFARQAAMAHGATVLLKGRRTVIVDDWGRRIRVNTTGTGWLATAGAGDVLAGLIGSLLAAGLDEFDAASLGAWLHGRAAEIASDGGPITAGQVADALPGAIRATLRGTMGR